MSKNITINMIHPDDHPAPQVVWCVNTQAWRLPGGGKTTDKDLAVGIMVRNAMACGYKKPIVRGV